MFLLLLKNWIAANDNDHNKLKFKKSADVSRQKA